MSEQIKFAKPKTFRSMFSDEPIRGRAKTPFDQQKRLMGSDLALCEIHFANGFKSVTTEALPHWRHWRRKEIFKPGLTHEKAFEAGVLFAEYWVKVIKIF